MPSYLFIYSILLNNYSKKFPSLPVVIKNLYLSLMIEIIAHDRKMGYRKYTAYLLSDQNDHLKINSFLS